MSVFACLCTASKNIIKAWEPFLRQSNAFRAMEAYRAFVKDVLDQARAAAADEEDEGPQCTELCGHL